MNEAATLPDPRDGERLTEQRNPRTLRIDRMSTAEALAAMQAEDRIACEAAAACGGEVLAAIELAVASFRRGGRLIYVGAGTSGRLGVLDASEQPPTFGVPREMVQGIIAGGAEALTRSIEGIEDRADEGERAIIEANAGAADTVMGITTGGRAAYVLAALAEARRRGAATVLLTCTPPLQGEERLADVQIHALTGPEAIAGSTRLKAGTATKLILNQITTLSMVRMGKVYGNLMVDLRPVNRKLRERARRILCEAAGIGAERAQELIEEAGDLKTALTMALTGTGQAEARQRLSAAQGNVAKAVAGDAAAMESKGA